MERSSSAFSFHVSFDPIGRTIKPGFLFSLPCPPTHVTMEKGRE